MILYVNIVVSQNNEYICERVFNDEGTYDDHERAEYVGIVNPVKNIDTNKVSMVLTFEDDFGTQIITVSNEQISNKQKLLGLSDNGVDVDDQSR